MNITRNEIDPLNATIQISVAPEDYQEKVDAILKDYRKKARMPGFRNGKVPMGMIRKMYGKSALADELNKLLSEKLYQYIESEKLQVLGHPLPQESPELDLDQPDGFEFNYDIGLAPEFEVSLSSKDKFTYYTIAVDDALIDKYVTDLTKRHGKVAHVDESQDEGMIYGEFSELDAEGNPDPAGIVNSSTIALEYVEDEDVRKSLLGLKANDLVTVDPNKVSRGTADLAKMLNIDNGRAERLTSQFQLKVISLYRIDPAAVDQTLFDQVFGPGAISSESEFREKVAEQLRTMFVNDTDWKLKKDLYDRLNDKLKLALPDGFLKRWLKSNNESQLTEEQIENDYQNYAEGLKRQLIEQKIMKANGIEVNREEMTERAKEIVREQLARYGQLEPEEQQVEALAVNVLGKEEDAKNIYDQLAEAKLLTYFKGTVKLVDKEVSFDDFVKLASGKASKSKFMDNLTNLIKFK